MVKSRPLVAVGAHLPDVLFDKIQLIEELGFAFVLLLAEIRQIE